MMTETTQVKTGAWKELQLEFHNFIVVEQHGMQYPTEKSKLKKRYVTVRCKLCGLEYRGPYQLFKDRDKVCKCESRKGHGKIATSSPARKRILKIRLGMISRCHNKDSKAYHYYGGRGIHVCDGWLNSFDEFYNWALNNGYEENLSIERIDNDKGYHPENCTWISRRDQCRNRRNVMDVGQVKEIKKMLALKIPHKKISAIVGTSVNSVARISGGQTWSDID